MNLDKILKEDPEKLKGVVKDLKGYIANKNKYIANNSVKLFKQHAKNIKNTENGGWTEKRTMKKTFSVPLDVYMSNPDYWKKVCKSKKLQKAHPEWQVK